MSNGHRWSKFWWQDWANDPALFACSLAAQGLWMRLLCIMNDATPRGYLLLNGVPPTPRQLSTISGATLKELSKLLAELREANVYSRDEAGVIFSRRMVRDTAATEQGKRTGKKGGNPNLKRRDNGANPTEGVNPPRYPPPLSPTLNPPRYPPPLTGGLNAQEAEAESEAEAEERKRREESDSSLSSESSAPRERREAIAPAEGESFDDYLLRLRAAADAAPADPAAVRNAAGKVVRMLDGRRGRRTRDQAYRPPKASPAAMAADVLRGDVVPDLVPDGWKQPQPREPVRTGEQMIAALGVTPEQLARSRQLAAERFGWQPVQSFAEAAQ